MTDVPLEERLASPASRNDAIDALARLARSGVRPGPPVLEQLAKIIREPESVARIGEFASILADIHDELFTIPARRNDRAARSRVRLEVHLGLHVCSRQNPRRNGST